MVAVEQQLLAFKAAMDAAEAAAAELQVTNAGLVAARESAVDEAAAAADEAKRLATEVMRLKDDLATTQEQLSKVKVGTVIPMFQCSAQIARAFVRNQPDLWHFLRALQTVKPRCSCKLHILGIHAGSWLQPCSACCQATCCMLCCQPCVLSGNTLSCLCHCTPQEVADQDQEQWQGQLEAFKKQLHMEKQEREAAVAMAAARLTAEEGLELEQRCQEVRAGQGLGEHGQLGANFQIAVSLLGFCLLHSDVHGCNRFGSKLQSSVKC